MNFNLKDILLHRTDVGDLVLIKDGGWQICCTMIDHEDLFIYSLDNKLLEKEVEEYYYEEQDWTTKNVLIVDLKEDF